MENKKEIQTTEPEVDPLAHLNEEEKAQLEKLFRIMQSKDFSGFCGCNHNEKDGEPEPLWNDMGHRLVVEQAIWILAAIEPGSGFLSLWSQQRFRKGFYQGLYDADYKSPYNNPTKRHLWPWLPLIPKGFSLYTSHFYNPENGKHFGMMNILNKIGFLIEDFDATARTQVIKFAGLAADLHESWRKRNGEEGLYDIGYQLGLATHYFTDLTQPMHAANFAAVFGKEGHWVPHLSDRRHSHFEHLVDAIIKKPGEPSFSKLFCDPGTVTNFYDHEHSLSSLTQNTAATSKNIFDNHIDIPGRLDNWPWGSVPPQEEAMEAYERAFPAGQLSMAKFFQLWARLGDNNTISSNLRSDYVATSVRIDSDGEFQPCMFYKKDGSLNTAFRFYDNGEWHEDVTTFKEYGGRGKHGAAPFAACYDIKNKHASLFHVREDFGLDFWEVLPGGWKKTEIPNLRMNGSISAVFDKRYNKPSAFFRGADGNLYYLHYRNGTFAVSSVGTPKVGGVISAVWDETDCGLGGDVKGHMAVSYVGGDGFVYLVQMREGKWKITKIHYPSHEYSQCDAQTLAAIWDDEMKAVGIFWGMITYNQRNGEIRERNQPELIYSVLKGNNYTYELIRKYIVRPGEVFGGIAAVSKPVPSVLVLEKNPQGGCTVFTTLTRILSRGTWGVSAQVSTDCLGMIDTSIWPDGSTTVGCRTLNRALNKGCFISKYKHNPYFPTGAPNVK